MQHRALIEPRVPVLYVSLASISYCFRLLTHLQAEKAEKQDKGGRKVRLEAIRVKISIAQCPITFLGFFCGICTCIYLFEVVSSVWICIVLPICCQADTDYRGSV